jgi:hypothetical protein
MNLLRIEIHPVLTKTFDQTGTVKEAVSHYLGFIHGVADLGIKNLYMTATRREMIDQMFATLAVNGIQLS